ncbi:uncharacterized protein [Primulina eburnea]|uniref:uncharacterized protein n=1 Tax=Primulina eburnea TaxID=1245227 RepID=UPI003C6C8CB0
MMQRVETQLGQLVTQMATRARGSLPSDTKKNPKGVNAVTVTPPMKQEVVDVEENVKERGSSKQHSKDARETGKSLNSNPTVDINLLSFPQRAKQLQLDTQFSKFLEIFKKLHINIPFAEALAQMPSYAKFLKEMLSNKRKLVDFETVRLSEECSTILQNKLPPKAKDPGASINLMHYSCFEKLGIGEVKPTTISLQLADRSIRYPRGVVEDVLVKELIGEDPLEICLTDSRPGELENEDIKEYMHYMEAGRPISKTVNSRIGELGHVPRPLKSSIEEAPILEMKHLPSHLKYLFLLDIDKLPVIVSSTLTGTEEENLLRVLRDNIKAIGWSIADIKGIITSMCMHKILMEADHKTSTQPQRCMNPAMQEVVKKEVIKLLDTGIIYQISDSRWVNPVQVVPKKDGITVVKNENNELIPTKTITG